MFSILGEGVVIMTIPWSFNALITCVIAVFADLVDLAPVQIILPDLKSRVVVFGLFSLYTRPGNLSGLYFAPGVTCRITSRSRC
jgi:hypothetical protein